MRGVYKRSIVFFCLLFPLFLIVETLFALQIWHSYPNMPRQPKRGDKYECQSKYVILFFLQNGIYDINRWMFNASTAEHIWI